MESATSIATVRKKKIMSDTFYEQISVFNLQLLQTIIIIIYK